MYLAFFKGKSFKIFAERPNCESLVSISLTFYMQLFHIQVIWLASYYSLSFYLKYIFEICDGKMLVKLPICRRSYNFFLCFPIFVAKFACWLFKKFIDNKMTYLNTSKYRKIIYKRRNFFL
jgi:hypothetical protein